MSIPRYWKERAVEALNSGNDDYLIARYLTDSRRDECDWEDIMGWMLTTREITEVNDKFILIHLPYRYDVRTSTPPQTD
jgi:hypothetical protein